MKQATHTLHLRTSGKRLYEFTDEVNIWLRNQMFQTGLLTLFVQHTSASLAIQENADPDVIADLNDWFERIAPERDPRYRHTMEGPDDMPAHIRTVVSGVHLSVPVISGALALGTWQGIYLFEHRARPHTRTVILHLIGE